MTSAIVRCDNPYRISVVDFSPRFECDTIKSLLGPNMVGRDRDIDSCKWRREATFII